MVLSGAIVHEEIFFEIERGAFFGMVTGSGYGMRGYTCSTDLIDHTDWHEAMEALTLIL